MLREKRFEKKPLFFLKSVVYIENSCIFAASKIDTGAAVLYNNTNYETKNNPVMLDRKQKMLLVLLAVVGCVITHRYMQNKSLKKQLDEKQNDIDFLEHSYMKLLIEYIIKQQEIPEVLQDD